MPGGDVAATASDARCTFIGGIHWRDECGAGADECGAGDDVGCVSTESGCCAIRSTETGEPVVSNEGRFSEMNAGS